MGTRTKDEVLKALHQALGDDITRMLIERRRLASEVERLDKLQGRDPHFVGQCIDQPDVVAVSYRAGTGGEGFEWYLIDMAQGAIIPPGDERDALLDASPWEVVFEDG